MSMAYRSLCQIYNYQNQRASKAEETEKERGRGRERERGNRDKQGASIQPHTGLQTCWNYLIAPLNVAGQREETAIRVQWKANRIVKCR